MYSPAHAQGEVFICSSASKPVGGGTKIGTDSIGSRERRPERARFDKFGGQWSRTALSNMRCRNGEVIDCRQLRATGSRWKRCKVQNRRYLEEDKACSCNPKMFHLAI